MKIIVKNESTLSDSKATQLVSKTIDSFGPSKIFKRDQAIVIVYNNKCSDKYVVMDYGEA